MLALTCLRGRAQRERGYNFLPATKRGGEAMINPKEGPLARVSEPAADLPGHLCLSVLESDGFKGCGEKMGWDQCSLVFFSNNHTTVDYFISFRCNSVEKHS